MVAEQAHCDIRAAFGLIFATSADRGRSANDVALDVIAGTVTFDQPCV
jgi:hypothetical protein